MSELVLASQSPRRAELLTQLGVRFSVRPAHIDESPMPGEAPDAYVQRMAREKARGVAAGESRPVLGADTTVVLDGESLGKPADRDAGREMLQRLSGREHEVLSAVCLFGGDENATVCVATRVAFCDLSTELIEAYLSTDEPWDKAGGYAIQGLAGALVRSIAGSYSNVVGLPLAETRELLQRFGVATALDAAV